jgi:hypothetical protein
VFSSCPRDSQSNCRTTNSQQKQLSKKTNPNWISVQNLKRLSLLNWTLSKSPSKSHVTTDSQSVSQYVYVPSTLWNLWPDIIFCLKHAVLSLWGTLSDERTGLSPCSNLKLKLIYDWRSVSQSVCLGVGSHLEPMTRFLYTCFWALPEQSLSGQSPAELRPCFTVSFETPPTCKARSPYLHHPGTGWPSYTPGHCVPFSSPLTTRRATVEVF